MNISHCLDGGKVPTVGWAALAGSAASLTRRPGPWRWSVLLGILLVCLIARPATAWAGDTFHVEQLQVKAQGETMSISAQIVLGKLALLKEILDQGVTLHWVAEAEWREPAPFAFLPGVGVRSRVQRVWRLHYYPLTNQYALLDNGQEPQLFAHWSALIAVLSEVRDLRLPVPHGAPRGAVALRVYVDVDALPLPLRLRALLGHWKLESEWTSSAVLP
ncbi:DUF4390 domain-containing protein [Acidithiobacillus sulfuriphilus]|uniref:DUF4390 domain-containing protein n=2 Tax=Acidithiobacillus sulfuriphilus TaxID=1867749 RepID=A0A3M8R897_9PROT|nr:DUF4390 domain-containing protein [Acidithiobacillus sulfuriphilus]RNF64787.1 DUF4390 domain-containing protein [Acidithiobacillus sulfuriphilus]